MHYHLSCIHLKRHPSTIENLNKVDTLLICHVHIFNKNYTFGVFPDGNETSCWFQSVIFGYHIQNIAYYSFLSNDWWYLAKMRPSAEAQMWLFWQMSQFPRQIGSFKCFKYVFCRAILIMPWDHIKRYLKSGS